MNKEQAIKLFEGLIEDAEKAKKSWGLGIGIWAQINLYVNGTTEDLAKYLFWFGGR